MEAVTIPVQSRKVSGRKRWDVEQKLAVLREWKEGLPLQELCRPFNFWTPPRKKRSMGKRERWAMSYFEK